MKLVLSLLLLIGAYAAQDDPEAQQCISTQRIHEICGATQNDCGAVPGNIRSLKSYRTCHFQCSPSAPHKSLLSKSSWSAVRLTQRRRRLRSRSPTAGDVSQDTFRSCAPRDAPQTSRISLLKHAPANSPLLFLKKCAALRNKGSFKSHSVSVGVSTSRFYNLPLTYPLLIVLLG